MVRFTLRLIGAPVFVLGFLAVWPIILWMWYLSEADDVGALETAGATALMGGVMFGWVHFGMGLIDYVGGFL